MAALLALLFTWMQVSQANKELTISERGQITGRFNSAVTNLGSAPLDTRLGGIFALEQIMHDSPDYQATIVSVIAAYVREHAPASDADLKKIGEPANDGNPPPPDIDAAVNALTSRNPERDRYSLDLRRADLKGLEFPPTKKFRGALFSKSDLSSSTVEGLDLRGAYLDYSNLSGAIIWGSDLSDADLQGVNAIDTDFCAGTYTEGGIKSGGDRCETKLTGAVLSDANLSGAVLVGSDLSGALLCLEQDEVFTEPQCPNFTGAYLNAANLKGANLSGANLRGADLSDADLTAADLSHADLTDANLTGAKTADADFHEAKMKRAKGLATSR
ncbi:pentapeptide repeat-containing protein [Streptomyces sp. NBC_00289]|uniref:pentapeptide repeat-containing protein n=1 Tax=Streptomyces sp. NBC_00289 TaxID=2975703 RepID=UPI003253B57C